MWARVGESRRRKAGAVQVEAPARSKGGDELDPYVRCTLLPYKIKAECKPVTDAGHYPEWSDKHRNVLRLTVSKKQAQREKAAAREAEESQTHAPPACLA